MAVVEALIRTDLARPRQLDVPPAARHAVVRTGLVHRVCTAPPSSVAVIVAPAGYGKTTLLAQCAQRDGRDVLGVAFEPEDDDASGVELLLGEMADEPNLLVLLDDVHVLQSRDALGTLERLLDRLAGGTTVVLSGRRLPQLPLARLRAEGRLLEIGVDELALSKRETETLLRRAGAPLPRPDGDGSGGTARRLARRTVPRRPLDSERHAVRDGRRQRRLSRRLPRDRAPLRSHKRTEALRQERRGARRADPRGVRRAPRPPRLERAARSARERWRGRGDRPPPPPALPLPAHRPGRPPRRARAGRAGASPRAAPCRGRPRGRAGIDRGGVGACGRRSRRRPGRRARRRSRRLELRTRAARRARAVALVASRRASRGVVSRSLSRGLVAARRAGPRARRPALGRRDAARPPRRRRAPPRSAGAALPRRGRPDARRHDRRLRSAASGRLVAAGRHARARRRAPAGGGCRQGRARPRRGGRARGRGGGERASDRRPLLPCAARHRRRRPSRRGRIRGRGGCRRSRRSAGQVSRGATRRGGRRAERGPPRRDRARRQPRWSEPSSSSTTPRPRFPGSPRSPSSSWPTSG